MTQKKTPAQLDADIAEALERRKSPLRVVCRTLAFGIKSCDWKVVGAFRGAEFASRKYHETAIIHQSTRKPGTWQVSFFDDMGAVRDSQHSTVEDALKQVTPKLWKLKALP
jgi:hypothetical protein